MDNDSLYALKIYYEDEYSDEYQIIIKLKLALLNNGMTENDANNRLYEFYDSFGSNIDISVFANIELTQPVTIQMNDNNDDDEDDEENDDEDDENIINHDLQIISINHITFNIANNNDQIQYISNNNLLFGILTHNILQTDDVVSSLCEEDISKLNKYELKDNLKDKCAICIDSMETTQEVIELDCKHIYHSQCIIEYFTKYNYKCPCCKKEAGKPVHNI